MSETLKSGRPMKIIVHDEHGIKWHVVEVKDNKVYTHEWQNACLNKDAEGKHRPTCEKIISRIFDVEEFDGLPEVGEFVSSTPEEIVEQKKMAKILGMPRISPDTPKN